MQCLKQLRKGDFCIEPEQKDTFPAVCLALAYLSDKRKVDENEVVVLCPIDVDAELFFSKLLKSWNSW